MGARSHLGAQLHSVASDDAVLRLDLFGRLISSSGLGAYVQSAATWSDRTSLDSLDDSTLALGNLDVGGLYAASGDLGTVVLRAGAALSTSTPAGYRAHSLAMPARVTDFANVTPDTSWIRLSASPRIDRGRWFAQVDLGVDVPLGDTVPGPPYAEEQPARTLTRINGALGWRLNKLALTGEAAVLTGFTGGQTSTYKTLTFSSRYAARLCDLYLGMTVPLDAFDMAFMLGLGAESRF